MESRVAELEIKFGLAEDHMDELDRTVFRQQQQIDRLQAQLHGLLQLIQNESPDEPRNLREEIPPHY